MSFTLEIHFHCLFCYVRDPNEQKVHLLAPATKGHDHPGSGVCPHVVRVIRVRPGTCEHHPYTHEIITLDGKEDWAEGWAVTLPEGTVEPPPDTLLPDLILDYTHHSKGRKIPPGHLGQHPGGKVASRFTLLGGDVASCVVDTFWEVEGQNVDLAREVVWTIEDIPGNQLVWSRTRLNGSAATQQLPPLEAEESFMRLDIFHVQAGDFPPPFKRRRPDENAAHVAAFSDLFDGSAAVPLVPKVRPGQRRSITVGCASVKGEVR